MIIYSKNKHTLQIDDFNFRCSIGKNGKAINKIEGDFKTPIGDYGIEKLYYRADRINKPETSLKTVKIKNNMGWCDDTRFPTKYNKLIKINKKIKHERIKRRDSKYDLLIPIKYNFNKPIVGRGSCIFIHLTNTYKPTAGCIALDKKDFLIMLKIININTKIMIT